MTTELCYTYYIQLVERLVEFPSDCRTKVHFCSKKKFSSQAPEPYLIRTFPVNLCFFSSYLYHRFSNQQPTKLSMYFLFCVCAFTREENISLIKIACFMLNVLNLKRNVRHLFFVVASSLSHEPLLLDSLVQIKL